MIKINQTKSNNLVLLSQIRIGVTVTEMIIHLTINGL
jgi:hypothetical protein